jgi:DNA-directed RNA polymerase specialized sigma24 family protein
MPIEDLFRAHWGLVFGYLRRGTGDPRLAEDLAQETFTRAARGMSGFRGGSPTAWLLMIARHVLIDWSRRGHPALLPLDADQLVMGGPDVTGFEVRRVLASLPTAQQRLLVLVHFDGFSLVEVAAMTGRTEAAVKAALFRAREAFKERWADGDDDW